MEETHGLRRSRYFASLNQKRWQHSLTILNHKDSTPWLYAIGGCDSRSNFMDSIERFNLTLIDDEKAKWTLIGRKLPTPMSKIQIMQFDSNHILLIGGSHQVDNTEKYNERTTA